MIFFFPPFQAEVRLNLVLQIMEEVLDLFEEDQSFASWAEATAADFLYVVSRQAEELHSCVSLSISQIFICVCNEDPVWQIKADLLFLRMILFV